MKFGHGITCIGPTAALLLKACAPQPYQKSGHLRYISRVLVYLPWKRFASIDIPSLHIALIMDTERRLQPNILTTGTPVSVSQLLEDVFHHVATTKSVSSADMLTLFSLAPPAELNNALALIDGRKVYHLTAQNCVRSFHEVREITGSRVFTCFSGYCSCNDFVYHVLIKGDLHMCAHQLACRIAHAIGACGSLVLSDEEFAVRLARANQITQ
eukprot:TRINITY_DN2294_c3_g1_i1.p1 TRINITY_DN2294_c3_g1~~TRINITY_DN2294_c3_g1_i1.p1  ORF type:complete len:213 (+),score=9.71 TRINITY_DN2294_c3_g1_i1:135-773(+)